MTATLFNRSAADSLSRSEAKERLPPRFERILIVGGGTAGWMTALIFARALEASRVTITVVESATIPPIGVGEGSTPWLRGFFDSLDIEEAEWMPACHATYKCGITFDRWSTKPGFEHYFHPFASMLDNLTMTQFVHNADARVNGADVHAHPDAFFIATRLAHLQRAPKAAEAFPFDVWYGYHFDSSLLGEFLKRKAIERGVLHRVAHVTHADLTEGGDLRAVHVKDGESIAADFFVDCSGFNGLLITQALHTPFVSFADNLFNDRAVALPSPIGTSIPSQTVSTALSSGWAWRIPLTERFGNGYVYSSAFLTPDQAEHELRAHLGLLDSNVTARHLTMRIGRLTRHWNRNCLAVGLAQGFIEPLEATALLFIQQTATNFIGQLLTADVSETAREKFNTAVNQHFEGTRDYIVTHYKTNSRTDSEYWRANAANLALSDPLKHLLNRWMSGRGIAEAVRRQVLGRAYPVFSWYALLAGMGIFPDREQLRAPTAAEAMYRLADIDDLLERSATHFADHRETLARIPPRRAGRSLQLYLW